ncbi:MAG TPA: aminotransferase class I/II-fold pyridoxal phosphate-dependent enzyme, partial [Chroococcales cyanobacterium]
VRIARQLKAGLYIDEAHATGVFGRHGMGLVTKEHGVDLVMGTFGKGLGSFGGYIACSSIIRDYLINFCPGIIYSTALPPAVLGAIDAALDLIPGPEMDAARAQLLEQSEDLRVKVKKLGFDTAQSSTQIVPLIVGADKSAVSLAAFLEEHGVYAPAIRQPTVPADSARVRLSLSSKHTAEHIDLLVDLLRRWNAES